MTKKGTKTIMVSQKFWKLIIKEKIRLELKTAEDVLKNWYTIYKDFK